MKPLTTIIRDHQGFFVNPLDWDVAYVDTLAVEENIVLEAAHYCVLTVLRNYYLEYDHLPGQRILIQLLKKNHPSFDWSSENLHQLFPEAPLRQASKLAGLPKPPHCL